MSCLASRAVRHLALDDAELPRNMRWLYLVCAVLSLPVFNRNWLEVAPGLWPQVVIGHAVPFIVLPIAIHTAYRLVMPALLRRTTSDVARIAAHLIVPALTSIGAGLVIAGSLSALGWKHAPLSGLLAMYVLMTWAFVFPAKLIVGWRRRADANARLAARNELYAIQSRAHPHFLFNAINAVASLIPEDPRRAEEALVRFADVLRYILETSTLAAIPLRRDVAILREYLEIQRVRFEALEYSIDIEAGLDDVSTPPLLLLPLVENAVLHGGGGTVHVRIRRELRGLVLDVLDHGPGKGGSSREGTGTGLRDLTRRLELVYGKEASLVMRAAEPRGFLATVRLPT